MTAQSARDAIPPGTLDMLVLQTLARERELHGFEIADAILRMSNDVLQVEEGSLYPALQRMLVEGWIQGEWSRTDENRRARYYRLTPAGRRHLANRIASYQRVADAIACVLQPAGSAPSSAASPCSSGAAAPQTTSRKRCGITSKCARPGIAARG